MTYYPYSPETGGIYTLVSPTGAIAVFNDPTDPNYVGMLTEVTGLDSAEVRESTEDLVEADGGVHGNFYLGRRPITMSGRVFGHATALERSIRLDRVSRASMALRGDAILSWVPSTRVENFVRNPKMGLSVADWTASVGAGNTLTSGPTRITTDGVSDTNSLEVVVGGVSAGVVFVSNGITPKYMALNPGQVVSSRVKFKIAAGASLSYARLDLVFYDASGTAISVAPGTQVNLPTAGSWLDLVNVAATAPAGTVNVAIQVRVVTGATGSVTLRFDQAVINGGPISMPYFDGDTAGYYWQGDPNVSSTGNFLEMFTYVRRQQPFRSSGAWNKDFQLALVSEYAAVYSLLQKTSTVSSGSSVVVENRGSYSSFPLLRITGVASNPVVTNSTNGSAVATTGLTLGSGEVIEIDTLNHVANFTAGARAGQSANRYINYGNAAAWTYLATGNNSVGLTGGGTLAVVYRDTWA